MKTKEIFFASLLYIFFLGCKQKPALKQYNFHKVIKDKVASVKRNGKPFKMSICDELPFTWDNIIILTPYSDAAKLKKEGLNNAAELLAQYPELTLHEGTCILLFVENKNIVSYSFIPNVTLDFGDVRRDNKWTTRISKEESCHKLYLREKFENIVSIDIQ